MEILNEMKRVLKSNGTFIMTEMYRDNQTDKQLSHVKFHHFVAEIENIKGSFHGKTYTREEIINIAKSIELKDLDIFDYNYEVNDDQMSTYILDACDECLVDVKMEVSYGKRHLVEVAMIVFMTSLKQLMVII